MFNGPAGFIARNSDRPCSPIRAQFAMSWVRSSWAAASAAAARFGGSSSCTATVTASNAQRRLTAVGRVASRAALARCRCSIEGLSASAWARPNAAVIPINGAPRTCMVLMAWQ